MDKALASYLGARVLIPVVRLGDLHPNQPKVKRLANECNTAKFTEYYRTALKLAHMSFIPDQ